MVSLPFLVPRLTWYTKDTAKTNEKRQANSDPDQASPRTP